MFNKCRHKTFCTSNAVARQFGDLSEYSQQQDVVAQLSATEKGRMMHGVPPGC